MATMTLRGLDEKTATALKDKAHREGTSVNSLTLRLLKQSLGLEKPPRTTTHHDLDRLAGTWNAADADEFSKATAAFATVDEGLWK
jgi:plasmid stability protein